MSTTTVWYMTHGFAVGVLIGLSVVLALALAYAMLVRRRHGGGMPLPAWVLTAKHASPELRALVAKMARAAARDWYAEWDTLPPGLQSHLRKEVGRMVAEAFAIHDGRRS